MLTGNDTRNPDSTNSMNLTAAYTIQNSAQTPPQTRTARTDRSACRRHPHCWEATAAVAGLCSRAMLVTVLHHRPVRDCCFPAPQRKTTLSARGSSRGRSAYCGAGTVSMGSTHRSWTLKRCSFPPTAADIRRYFHPGSGRRSRAPSS